MIAAVVPRGKLWLPLPIVDSHQQAIAATELKTFPGSGFPWLGYVEIRTNNAWLCVNLDGQPSGIRATGSFAYDHRHNAADDYEAP